VRISSRMSWLRGLSAGIVRLSAVQDSINFPSKLILGFQLGQGPRGKSGLAAMNAIQNASQPQAHSGALTSRMVSTSQVSTCLASTDQLASDKGLKDGGSGKKGICMNVRFNVCQRCARFETHHELWDRLRLEI
jgi:hypothetical protein